MFEAIYINTERMTMADHTGQQLGNYRLVRLLGRGGFAEVYLGEHIRLNTQAAIKVRYEQFGQDDAEQFLKEAQTIANLVHPHIVRIFDFDVSDGMPFLVMDYAPNGTLRQRYPKNTRLPLETIISNIKQITDGLQYAHDEKFIHRDIKPDNMLLGRRDDILLSDFGLALVAQSTRQQSLQELGGTAYYMAPEQLRGKPRQASDQYALGIVVYEWLTGERPFNGSFSEVASQHIFEAPPSIHEKLPSVSPAVEEVVMTALAKDPHQRFGSVRSFANALEQASKVSGSFPGMGLLSQPPAVPPPPANPDQSYQQPPVLPANPAQPVQPEQPVTAQPAHTNYHAAP
jgi:serine/threonine protein kinase